MKTEAQNFLDRLNREYAKLHTQYEELFWISRMGDYSVDEDKDSALKARNEFGANKDLFAQVKMQLNSANNEDKIRLQAWELFFSKNQTPSDLLELRAKIDSLESEIGDKRANRSEGYNDPATGDFVKMSAGQMREVMRTSDNESLRKACFLAIEDLSLHLVEEYVELVGLRNEYARGLGFDDFYAYKIFMEEGMTKEELFEILDSIYEKTKGVFDDIRKMEEDMPGLRQPWNFSYMLSGDFTKEEDPYLQFEEALMRWGGSFAALGIDYRGGVLQLDLLDREGKYDNGFCHWPNVVNYENGKRVPGSSNFTCNAIPDQLGSGARGLMTLFHEGGHAAHLLNSEQTEVCLSTELPPSSTAWTETQSMFLDTVASSIEWLRRYAVNSEGKQYPFELFERKLRKLHALKPLRMLSISFVSNFEKEVYECKDLSVAEVKRIAKEISRRYLDQSQDTYRALDVPHIYSWDSACSYHGYGLAMLALQQWRDYFYEKYGFIVDNPNVGREMTEVWKLAASKTFKELVVLATGEPLSPESYIRTVTMSLDEALELARERVDALEAVPRYTGVIQLNATIKMVHSKTEICSNKNGFEEMAAAYKAWIAKISNNTETPAP